jgi:opacity protein-like surface antigen
MKRLLLLVALVVAASINAPAASVQQPAQPPAESATRVATREKMRKHLDTAGPLIGVSFRQSTKQPFNFIGVMTQGLTHAESLEIVIGVTAQDTINFRVYPHYKGGYINVDKVRNAGSLMRQLLVLSDRAFLFWGMDARSAAPRNVKSPTMTPVTSAATAKVTPASP